MRANAFEIEPKYRMVGQNRLGSIAKNSGCAIGQPRVAMAWTAISTSTYEYPGKDSIRGVPSGTWYTT